MNRNEATPARMHPADVQESLRRWIGDAKRALQNPRLSDEAIHRARKDLKRARAHLRLLRKALGNRAYARENAALRDASRPLGLVRDAKVMVETVDALLERDENAARCALLEKVRALLEKARQGALETVNTSGVLDTSTQALENAWQRTARRRVPRGRSLLRQGMKTIYRRGRNALVLAKTERSAEALHEWRKHVKYLGNALCALRSDDAGRVSTVVERAQAVADSLGEHHDLVVLEDEVAKLHSQASRARSGLFQGLAERRRKLEARALKQGRALFGKSLKTFMKGLPRI